MDYRDYRKKYGTVSVVGNGSTAEESGNDGKGPSALPPLNSGSTGGATARSGSAYAGSAPSSGTAARESDDIPRQGQISVPAGAALYAPVAAKPSGQAAAARPEGQISAPGAAAGTVSAAAGRTPAQRPAPAGNRSAQERGEEQMRQYRAEMAARVAGTVAGNNARTGAARPAGQSSPAVGAQERPAQRSTVPAGAETPRTGRTAEADSVSRTGNSGNQKARTKVNRAVTGGGKKKKNGSALSTPGVMKAVIVLLAVLLVVGLTMMIYSIASSRTPKYIAKKVRIEVGRSAVNASDFIVSGTHTAVFEEKTSFDLNVPGSYRIYLNVDGKSYTSRLRVEDTVPPQAQAAEVTVRKGGTLEARDCVTDIVDRTEVRVTFVTKPDLSVVGLHRVTVLLTDAGGNETELPVYVNVVENGALLRQSVTVEVGSPVPDVTTFLGADPEGGASYVSDVSAIDTSRPGTYSLEISSGGTVHGATLIVADTTAPTATITPQTVYNNGQIPPAAAFVSDIRDASAVTVEYASVPGVPAYGSVPVTIILTDAYGNKTIYNTVLNAATDIVPPVIQVKRDRIEINAGDAIAWRACVDVSDDSGWCDVVFDSSGADLKRAGSYNCFFVATDAAGNQTRAACTLLVHDPSVTQEMLDKAVQSLEKELFPTPMTIEKKLYELYLWLSSNQVGKLKYVNDSDHDDWRKEAYTVLTSTHSGDCFAYASVAHAVFCDLGLDCMIVERAPEYHEEGTHFWNLVNIGTESNPKWYHFDGTPQRGDFRVPAYAMTDAQVRAYTNWRNAEQSQTLNYYKYDTSLYPASSPQIIERFGMIPAKYYD